jgi:NAD(P)-dependent dehydrogenase (short-subunit alcohol dehydrogenase family)
MSEETRWPTAFISGGGSGIGLQVAAQLRARGTALAILDLSINDQARERLGGGTGPAVSFHEVDVTDAGAMVAVSDDAVAAAGAPSLALNSAGIQVSKVFGDLSEERFRQVIDVNLIGSRNFAAAMLPLMSAGGQLALVASLAGIVANYGYAAYNASKFGVVGLAGALRLESKPRGIDVSVICPPEVETPMVADERRTGDPVGLRLKKVSGTLGVEQACDEIVSGLERRKYLIIPGRRARLTHRLAGMLPGLMNRASDRMVEQTLNERR